MRIHVAVALSLIIACGAQSSEPVNRKMTGHWEGNGLILVSWCRQTNLPVKLDIRSDGTVTGKIGDAALTKGQLRRNRNWVGMKLHMKADYIITGQLSGPIVKAENITRSGVNIPLNLTNGNLMGGMHTTGWKFGSKERGILTAGLILVRTPKRDAITPPRVQK